MGLPLRPASARDRSLRAATPDAGGLEPKLDTPSKASIPEPPQKSAARRSSRPEGRIDRTLEPTNRLRSPRLRNPQDSSRTSHEELLRSAPTHCSTTQRPKPFTRKSWRGTARRTGREAEACPTPGSRPTLAPARSKPKQRAHFRRTAAAVRRCERGDALQRTSTRQTAGTLLLHYADERTRAAFMQPQDVTP